MRKIPLAGNIDDNCHSAGDTGKLSREEETRVATMEQLEQKVDELIELCTILGRENRALRAQQQNWSSERAKLIEKNELAKSRVESMITRLKTLEQD
jgi:cell division protein ZapB